MTKYFKAEVVLQKLVKLNVAAADEATARRQAAELAVQGMPGCEVSKVSVQADGETEYGVGVRVKHFLFGTGEITALSRTTNYRSDIGYHATIKFDSGDTKDLHLPLARDKLEVVSE